jgi:hypothetical protein
MRVGFLSGRGDPIGAGYARVKVVGECNWVRHEGGAGCGQKTITEPWGLGFGKHNAGGLPFGQKGPYWGGVR